MSLKKNSSNVLSDQEISRHHYQQGIIELCISLIGICGLGLRQTVRVVKYLNSFFSLGLESIPSHTNIKNWVEKAGYSVYLESELQQTEQPYAVVIDESIQIGSEKLLMTLGLKADKSTESALKVSDVEILDLSVAKSWNGLRICQRLSGIAQKLRRFPSYVISDNGSIMNKGIRECSLVHIRDVGHSLAMFLERQYKNLPAFKSLMKDLCGVKCREILRPVSYLLPPKQRSIARFMNLTACLEWAQKIRTSFEKLSPGEQQVFKFIENHRAITDELNEIILIFNKISKLLKTKGLSKKTARICRKKLKPLFKSPSARISEAAKQCDKYLEEEVGKLPHKNDVWHISSDIIETVFGIYKQRKSPNTLTGVTSYVFLLPLLTKSDPESCRMNMDVKKAMEKIFLRDIHH